MGSALANGVGVPTRVCAEEYEDPSVLVIFADPLTDPLTDPLCDALGENEPDEDGEDDSISDILGVILGVPVPVLDLVGV
jgi:hypothetical protein